jgi:hypothetical protein
MCAVRTLRAYLEAAGIHRGPVFRRLRRGDTLDRPAALRSVGRAYRQAPRPHGRRPRRRALWELAARQVRDRRGRRGRRGAQDRQRHPRHKNLPVLRRYIRTRHRRSTTAATCFDPKPTQGAGSPPSSPPPAALGWRPLACCSAPSPPTRASAPTIASRPITGREPDAPGAMKWVHRGVVRRAGSRLLPHILGRIRIRPKTKPSFCAA